MRQQAIIDQVAGIFTRLDVPFGVREDGKEFRILRGSAAVFVSFSDWASSSTVVHFFAPVVVDLPDDPESISRAVAIANSFNQEQYFLKWVVAEHQLFLEYDLLGDRLDEDELMNAVQLISGVADDFDENLVEQLGGKSFEDKLSHFAEADEAPDGP